MTLRTMGLMASSLLVACDLEDTKDTDTETTITDDDGDGFAVEDDCDDADAAVNPDAAEACDGVDNNCDGAIDEGVTITVYADADGDGYGDDDSASDACAAEAGQSEIAGDCDDTDSAISPDASEICDTIDNDCDSLIDDDDDTLDLKTAQTWYADVDSDTFGDVKVSVLSCVAAKGSVADSTDCDDSAFDVYPGAKEICEDGVVNDCDSTVEDAQDACAGTIDHDADFVVRDSSGIGFGYDGNLNGDYNGDGIDDLLVGAYSTGKTADGESYIYYGSASGTGTFDESDADVTLTGESSSYFGLYGQYLGDIDSDGYDDILIGAYNLSDSKADIYGGMYIVYGGTTSGSILDDYGALIHGSSSDSLSQYTNHSVADFDGDGVSDISASSSAYNTQYVFSGLTTGTVALIDADTVISAGKSTPYLFESAAGDLDGDGTPDLVISDLNGASYGTPSVYIFSGGSLASALDLSDADATIGAKKSTAYLGYSLAVLEDTNGDGYADLAAGDLTGTSWTGTTSAAYLFNGPISGGIAVTDADAALGASYSGAYLGYSVGGGDYDGDGLTDMVVAEPLYVDSTGTTVGGAFLVYSDQLIGSISTDDVVLMTSSASSYNYGTDVGAAGDFNADGIDDILITSFVGNTSSQGDAHIIFGAARY
jgi:hypothetical protein